MSQSGVCIVRQLFKNNTMIITSVALYLLVTIIVLLPVGGVEAVELTTVRKLGPVTLTSPL